MKNIASSYRIIAVVIIVLALWGCKGAGRYGEESGTQTIPETTTTDGFDPLELPQDTRIVPQLVPKRGDIKGVNSGIDTTSDTATTTTSTITTAAPQMDTLASQALRIQIHATEVFSDAKKEHRVAQEIFDQPVYLDYEVPYYKVRVGGFADRKEAENYLLKAKRAGYSNAWIVAVRVNTKEAEPLYEDIPIPVKDTVKGN